MLYIYICLYIPLCIQCLQRFLAFTICCHSGRTHYFDHQPILLTHHSKKIPTYPRNIPGTLIHLSMKGIRKSLHIWTLGYLGYVHRFCWSFLESSFFFPGGWRSISTAWTRKPWRRRTVSDPFFPMWPNDESFEEFWGSNMSTLVKFNESVSYVGSTPSPRMPVTTRSSTLLVWIPRNLYLPLLLGGRSNSCGYEGFATRIHQLL